MRFFANMSLATIPTVLLYKDVLIRTGDKSMAFMYDENFHKRSGRASLKKRVYSENALNVVKTPLRIFSTIQKVRFTKPYSPILSKDGVRAVHPAPFTAAVKTSSWLEVPVP